MRGSGTRGMPRVCDESSLLLLVDEFGVTALHGGDPGSLLSFRRQCPTLPTDHDETPLEELLLVMCEWTRLAQHLGDGLLGGSVLLGGQQDNQDLPGDLAE